MTLINRPPRDWVLMKSAQTWAARSTCTRAQVGAVISREGRILSSGYNGSPAGMDHCNHDCICMPVTEPGLGLPPRWVEDRLCEAHDPCSIAVHAEVNAIIHAAKYGVGVQGAELHTTRMPCLQCAGAIINSGIKKVVWFEPHRDDTGLRLLDHAEVEVVRYTYE